MTLAAGERLGPFEIAGPIGAGGMGEVYRARDTRLGRDVAVKVLSVESIADPDRLERFEQEARAASALNHPNIVTIYDIGDDGRRRPTSRWSWSTGETLRRLLAAGRCPGRRSRSTSPRRSPTASRRRTRRGSSTATSSPRT